MALNPSITRRAFVRALALLTAASSTACAPLVTPAPETPPPGASGAPDATAATQAAPVPSFGEAPQLADLVQAGQLPPVADRLPLNPRVLTPRPEAGTYGGVWRRCEPGPGLLVSRMGAEPLVMWSYEGNELLPNLAESYEISDDGLTLTFHLREGLRWSDGEPFTAQDIQFWFSDVAGDARLNSALPAWLRPKGQPVSLELDGDHTVRFTYTELDGAALERFAFNGNAVSAYPRHYLSAFHATYADHEELTAAMEAAGLPDWVTLFRTRADATQNADAPTMRPWALSHETTPDAAIAKRNPFYWKVDDQGRQLPYIDAVSWQICFSEAEMVAAATAGQVDLQAAGLTMASYPALLEAEDAGGYSVALWRSGTAGAALYVNQTRFGDETQAMLLRLPEMRRAISRAIDRWELNQVFYFGLADDAAALFASDPIAPGSNSAYALDREVANALLDGLGLQHRDEDGYRLRQDGRVVSLVIYTHAGYDKYVAMAEVIADQLQTVGLRATVVALGGDAWASFVREGAYDLLCADAAIAPGEGVSALDPDSVFPLSAGTYWAPLWGIHHETAASEGEPPSEYGARLLELWQRLEATVPLADRLALGAEAASILQESLYVLPIVGGGMTPAVVSHKMANAPINASHLWTKYAPRQYNPETFFLRIDQRP